MGIFTSQCDGDWLHVLGPSQIGNTLLHRTRLRLCLTSFDADLGMSTYDQVLRQLTVDLPRSHVCIRGARTTNPDTLLRHTLFPRLATQAVLAPVVESLLMTTPGVVCYECGAPMCVDVHPCTGDVRVSKHLGLRTWEGDSLGETHVCLETEIASNSIFVSMRDV